MKSLIVSAALALMFTASAAEARDDEENFASVPEVHVGFFYEALAPYGEWIETEPGLYVWRPLNVYEGWRPYLEGRWVWTEYGWYWMSYEPFGWATFHYGRWYDDSFYGWVWIPDDVWGPAWVDWRYSDEYIGWAPLPPYARFSITIGIRYTRPWVAPIHYWSFVACNSFGGDISYQRIAPVEHVRRIIGFTRPAGMYEVDRDRVINRGVDREVVEQRTDRRFERIEVRNAREFRGERYVRGDATERIEVYRPSRTEMSERSAQINARRGERPLSIGGGGLEGSRAQDSRPRSQDRPTPGRTERPNPTFERWFGPAPRPRTDRGIELRDNRRNEDRPQPGRREGYDQRTDPSRRLPGYERPPRPAPPTDRAPRISPDRREERSQPSSSEGRRRD